MSAPDPVAAAVAAMWERNAARVLERLAAVIRGVDLLAQGEPPGAEAEQEAHVLAGALGTYARPGSSLLRRAELALARSSRGEAAGLLDELHALADQLRS